MTQLRLAKAPDVMAVTGGANGIGREVARQCLNKGGQVILLDLHADAFDAAVNQLGNQVCGVVDVTNSESVQAVMSPYSLRPDKLDLTKLAPGCEQLVLDRCHAGAVCEDTIMLVSLL